MTTQNECFCFTELDRKTIRGAFTYSLFILEQRLSHIPEAEDRLIIPMIRSTNWEPENELWKDAIKVRENKLVMTHETPYRIAEILIDRIKSNWKTIGIKQEDANKLSDICRIDAKNLWV